METEKKGIKILTDVYVDVPLNIGENDLRKEYKPIKVGITLGKALLDIAKIDMFKFAFEQMRSIMCEELDKLKKKP